MLLLFGPRIRAVAGDIVEPRAVPGDELALVLRVIPAAVRLVAPTPDAPDGPGLVLSTDPCASTPRRAARSGFFVVMWTMRRILAGRHRRSALWLPPMRPSLWITPWAIKTRLVSSPPLQEGGCANGVLPSQGVSGIRWASWIRVRCWREAAGRQGAYGRHLDRGRARRLPGFVGHLQGARHSARYVESVLTPGDSVGGLHIVATASSAASVIERRQLSERGVVSGVVWTIIVPARPLKIASSQSGHIVSRAFFSRHCWASRGLLSCRRRSVCDRYPAAVSAERCSSNEMGLMEAVARRKPFDERTLGVNSVRRGGAR